MPRGWDMPEVLIVARGRTMSGNQLLVGCHDVHAQIDKLCVMDAHGRNLHIVVATPDPVNYPGWGTHRLED
jgi:hypothetical protein